MRNPDRSCSHPVETLRLTIDCLPVATRRAMLAGVRASERIIVGAYCDGEGGICPMLAAHRHGARTNFLSFARAWDRFARASGRTRRATRRELAILIGQLESSLLGEPERELDRAIAEHRELVARRLLSEVPEAPDRIVVRRARQLSAR